jgi:hypothetical protein
MTCETETTWHFLAGGRDGKTHQGVAFFTVGGYIAGFIAGLALIYMHSFNTHDLNQEMAMTAIFFTGPIGALIGLVWGIFRRPKPAS